MSLILRFSIVLTDIKQHKMNIKNIYLLALLFLLAKAVPLAAQDVENTSQTRTEFKLDYKILDNLKVVATPELRFDETFSIDKYIFELKTVYNPFKRLSIGAAYRFVANKRNTKPTEYLQRYAFEAKYAPKINRWKPSASSSE